MADMQLQKFNKDMEHISELANSDAEMEDLYMELGTTKEDMQELFELLGYKREEE